MSDNINHHTNNKMNGSLKVQPSFMIRFLNTTGNLIAGIYNTAKSIVLGGNFWTILLGGAGGWLFNMGMIPGFLFGFLNFIAGRLAEPSINYIWKHQSDGISLNACRAWSGLFAVFHYAFPCAVVYFFRFPLYHHMGIIAQWITNYIPFLTFSVDLKNLTIFKGLFVQTVPYITCYVLFVMALNASLEQRPSFIR